MKTFIKIISLSFLLACYHHDISAQVDSNKVDSPINIIIDTTGFTDTTVHFYVESFPILITNEGEYKFKDLQQYIQKNLKYPENGNDCTEKVYITFIVEKDGSISNKEYLRKLCIGFDENAMNVIDSMKHWRPGLINNKPVRTQLAIAISWFIY